MSELVFEGTWDEIAGHAAELTGKKVRLTVLAENTQQAEAEEYAATVAALSEGIESFRRGEGRPAREALEELRLHLSLLSLC
jgi:hypothetical protein